MLASEAGIAMENARLFAEEQKKSRQLTLINNVSSHAITTLDPDEMLAKIAAEMEKNLPYDHIGIAILDYAVKGVGRPGRGRHTPRSLGTPDSAGRRLGRAGCPQWADGNCARGQCISAEAGFAGLESRLSLCP